MNYRVFYLMNKDDEKFELTNVEFNQFLNNPNGLGFSKTYSTLRLGDSDVVTSEQFNLMIVKGDVLFYGDNNPDIYQSYFNLIKYLSKAPIRLYYLPPNALEPYFSYVNVIQLDKSEINEDDGMLSCPIQLKMTSFWQTADTNEEDVYPDTGVGKFYPLVRKANEGYYYGGSALNNVQIFNDGTLETGLIIEIIGECEDPQINFYQDGEQYGVCKLNGTFDYVKVNSIDTEEDLELQYQGSDLANPMSYQDLSIGNPNNLYVTFVKLKAGETTLTVTFGSSFTGHVKFTWRDMYVSV